MVLSELLFFKFLEDISPFCRADDTLLWTSGDVCPGFQSQGGFPCLHASLAVNNGFLRFTSGVTPADCIEVTMAAEPF